ncbi:Adrenodoxin reductase [Gracilaria domingensis]|nr:Adrenodoxin reductase [Gracilaria domingensis]
MSSALPTDTRVGIIGGGPSGIAAAWFLVKNGYKNVTILEKDQEVGGAEYITYSYDVLYSFLEELNEPIRDAGPILAIEGGGKFGLPLDVTDTDTLLALLRYFKLVYEFRNEIAFPSNENLSTHPVLSMSSAELIKEYRLERIEGILLVQQFGYGPLEDFPALHLFRTVSHSLLIRIVAEELHLPFFERPVAALALNGTQGLFKNMATWVSAQKESVYPGSPAVLTGQTVTSVVPQGDTVQVHAAEMMELDEQWNSLFRKIRYHPYWVGCLEMFDQTLDLGYFQNEKLGPYEPAQFSKRYQEGEVIAYGYNHNYAEDAAQDPRPEIDSTLTRYLSENMAVSRGGYGLSPDGHRAVHWDPFRDALSSAI